MLQSEKIRALDYIFLQTFIIRVHVNGYLVSNFTATDTIYFGRSSAVSVEVFVDTMDAWILFFLGARGELRND